MKMYFPQEKEVNVMKKSKFSSIKEFFIEYGINILIVVVTLICLTLVVVLPIRLTPAYTTQATVTAVGYKGITVEYKSGYGQKRTKKIDVDDVTEYQIGDTVTIEIKALNVEIVEERDNEPN